MKLHSWTMLLWIKMDMEQVSFLHHLLSLSSSSTCMAQWLTADSSLSRVTMVTLRVSLVGHMPLVLVRLQDRSLSNQKWSKSLSARSPFRSILFHLFFFFLKSLTQILFSFMFFISFFLYFCVSSVGLVKAHVHGNKLHVISCFHFIHWQSYV